MSEIIEIVQKLHPFAYSVNGDGNDVSLPLWQAELPFKVYEFEADQELNGWRIPPNWAVLKAEIRKNGKLIYDGTVSPLGVITLSESFSGKVSLNELKEHLFYSDELEDAIVYHWTAIYRPQEKNWGFCLPKKLYEGLSAGTYEVELVTQSATGTMKVLEYTLPGKSHETIILNGHNCHPFQANDDISGCAVGIDVMKRLASLAERRFTYQLLIAPEIIGPVFWLDAIGSRADEIFAAIMLKSVGNNAPLKLQESYSGKSPIDVSANHVFSNRYGNYTRGAFRTIYGNDETVFEAPGYEIPSILLTRWPFPSYHTDQDTPDQLSEELLKDTSDTAYEICLALEKDICLKANFKGLVCLSHPKYDLYLKAPAPGIDQEVYTENMWRWNLLMNNLPRDIESRTSLLAIAERYEIPVDEVHAYCMKWVEKGLASIIDEMVSLD